MKTSNLLAILLAITMVIAAQANAQDHGGHGNEGHGRPGFVPGHSHMDGRFAHDHYYLDRGYQVHGVPHGAFEVHHGGASYFYDRNHWYRRNGGVSIVIGAPLGAFVPFLPLYYSTVWWHGLPYYYSNDTYYQWDADQNQYEVVAPPDGIESGGTTEAPASDQVFIYPKNGQSADQQQRDRYECHQFAVSQTGFDPTNPGGGVTADAADSKRSDYMRAQTACLEGRGYSVK
jgi:hypothetical protein